MPTVSSKMRKLVYTEAVWWMLLKLTRLARQAAAWTSTGTVAAQGEQEGLGEEWREERGGWMRVITWEARLPRPPLALSS